MSNIDPTSGLPDQQRRFCDEYLVDFNAGAAYQRAGYKATGNAAYAAASRLLANPKVQAYLNARKEELNKQLGLEQEAVLQRLAFMAMGDVRGLFREDGTLKDMHELSVDQASLIQGIEVVEISTGRGEERKAIGFTKKVKLVSRLDGVKLLGSHLGMFKQKHDHTHTHRVQGMSDILEEIDGADCGPGPASSRRD